MENVLAEFEERSVIYGTFWQRFLALFIDGLLLSPALFIDWYNKTEWKNSLLLIVVALLATIYKPFMEYTYGATLGKKAINLIVVSKDFEKPALRNILLRNIFDIGQRLLTLVIILMVFSMPQFQVITSIKEFSNLQRTVINPLWITIAPTVLVIIEIIFILTDAQKRSLHDRIGSTLVIRQ